MIVRKKSISLDFYKELGFAPMAKKNFKVIF